MGEDKKVLSIDPNLFSFSKNNTTRKREKKPKPDKEIKVKNKEPKKKTDTLKKKSILKMIRQHQEQRYKESFNEKAKIKEPVNNLEDGFNKDFKEAQLFLEKLTEKKRNENAPKHAIHNQTLKNYQSGGFALPIQTMAPLAASALTSTGPMSIPMPMPMPIPMKPLYGCLKNGSLPTYRRYMNITGKNQPSIIIGGKQIAQQNQQVQSIAPPPPIKKDAIPVTQKAIVENAEKQLSESMKLVNEINQTAGKMKQTTKPKKNKRKKILRRTFKIGKSKVFPKVAVLVSNKTLRNQITTKHQLLKQTPMSDVKKFLMKRGFIKVGSIAPNDVLRKMYEDVTMICGDVQNHNPENLLYNFLNSNEK